MNRARKVVVCCDFGLEVFWFNCASSILLFFVMEEGIWDVVVETVVMVRGFRRGLEVLLYL